MSLIKKRLVSVSSTNPGWCNSFWGAQATSSCWWATSGLHFFFHMLNSSTLPQGRSQEGGSLEEVTFPSKGMTQKLSLPLVSHWSESSLLTLARFKGSWEIYSLAGKQFDKLILLVSWRLARKLMAEPAISTLSSASHGINAPQMMFSFNYLEGD